MKIELTKELKAKFFALYWRQNVLTDGIERYTVCSTWNFKHPGFYLLLKPLSQISDDDVIEVVKIIGYDDRLKFSQVEEIKEWFIDRFGIGYIKHKWDCLNAFDFLRSRGYAIPFMGISVEEMIKSGWIKDFKDEAD